METQLGFLLAAQPIMTSSPSTTAYTSAPLAKQEVRVLETFYGAPEFSSCSKTQMHPS